MSNDNLLRIKANNKLFSQELLNICGGKLIFEQYLKEVKIVHEENLSVYVLYLEEETKDKYSSEIKRAIKNVYGEKYNAFLIKSLDEVKKNANENKEIKTKEVIDNITQDLTFENYSSGRFNKMAIRAAKTICESDSVQFSPFFIYSSSGLGKTHLLHAIGNEFKKRNKTALYINPDALTRRLVEQLKNKNEEQINKIVDSLTSYDCLMFDDIQIYGGKEQTLKVLFTIIEKMIVNNKQIVFASDKSPDDLGSFEERFITRFKGGLAIQIENPDDNDIIEVLKQKLLQNNINVDLWDPECLRFVARNYGHSIRELQGALNRIKIYADMDDYMSYDVYTFKNIIFKDVAKTKQSITTDHVLDAVAKYYKIEKRKILSVTRKEEVVNARRIATYIIKTNFENLTLEQIGKLFANQSHSTVINSLQWVEKTMKINSTIKVAIQKIQENIKRVL
ncbi:chromosomal replication initiator protein DnaA [Mycoplasma struthionis]|uniref:Chromosomal replication initiator protein DnaA n=1 Tax=Mycoplasma struthionis TaxID=538220 RepID=A0A3G8LG55_9MOLU|nr:chromosomal replication initiator protein DnaA [Mycoplasma struthionis]AZG68639.1 chromosomal replication initiator protein DnaA [Mycoplasma struthionis]TPI02293.1 chromosomal replication initiator protein DnaA [Mycoplasma struthionis]